MPLILRVSIANKPLIVIAALSSRIYAEAAVRNGYDVIVIDAFVDADVKKLARNCFQIGLLDNQLDGCQLLKILDSLDLQNALGFCYGAGFEKSPNLLTAINKRLPVLGNSASVVEKCKLPEYFFAVCKQLRISFPEVAYNMPVSSKDWILKRVGGSGGGHIKFLSDRASPNDAKIYYQKQQHGVSISCLFIAGKHGVNVIGINEQWLDSNDSEPYRYGGAVSHAEINQKAALCLIGYVRQLTQAFGLIGVNSCDAICDGDDVYVLEINPRMSATMDLYQSDNLMEKHIAASQMMLDSSEIALVNDGEARFAHQIIYSTHSLKLKNDIIWPTWVRDIPVAGAHFNEGMPICTVIAEAETAKLAKTLVTHRASILKREFLN